MKLYVKSPWKWYQLIAKGEKKEWYCPIDKYWQNKLFDGPSEVRGYKSIVISSFNCGPHQIELEILDIDVEQPKEQWNDNPVAFLSKVDNMYVIKLGAIIK